MEKDELAVERKWDGAFLALLMVLGLWFYWPILEYLQLNLEDEGDFVYPALRILNGQVLYRDFNSALAPGSILLLVTWMKVFGASFQAARWFAIVIALINNTLIYKLGRKFFAPIPALIASLAFCLTSFVNWPVTSYHWVGVMGLLVTLLACVRMIENPETRPAATIAGSTAIIAAFLLQSDGLCAIAACLSAAVVIGLSKGPKIGLKQLLAGVGGALATGLVGLFCFAAWAGWEPLLENIIFSHLNTDEVRLGLQKKEFIFFPYAMFQQGMGAISAMSWEELWAQKRVLANFFSWPTVYLLTHGLFYPLTALFFVVTSWRLLKQRDSLFFQFAAALSLAGLLASLTALYRPDPAHVTFVRLGWWVLLTAGMRAGIHSEKRWLKIGSVLLVAFLGSSIIIHSLNQREKWTRGPSYRVSLPNGTISISDARMAANLQAYSNFLRSEKKASPRIFVYPIFPMLYFLSNAQNVSRFERLVPVWSPDEHFEMTLEAIRDNDADFVVLMDFNYQIYLNEYPSLKPQDFIDADKRFRAQVLDLDRKVISIWPEFRIIKTPSGR